MLNLIITTITKKKPFKNAFLPILPEPNICTTKRAIIMTIVIGKIHCCNVSEVVAKPSTADKTLIAGVSAPSPKAKQTTSFNHRKT